MTALTCAFALERVTGIEPRTISLGIFAIRAAIQPDLRGRTTPLLSELLSPLGRTEIRTHGMNSRPGARAEGIHPARDRMTRRHPNHFVSEDPLPHSRGLSAGVSHLSIHFRPAAGFGCPPTALKFLELCPISGDSIS